MTSAVREILNGARGGPLSGRASATNLIGLDVGPGRTSRRRRQLAPVLVSGLLCALFLVALRVDLIRMRYAMAETQAHEQELFESQRGLTVQMRQLRDPARIAARARELGFIRPERIIDLPAPRAPATVAMAGAASGPEVARRP